MIPLCRNSGYAPGRSGAITIPTHPLSYSEQRSALLVGLLATFYDDLRQSTCYRTAMLDSNHPFLGGSPA